MHVLRDPQTPTESSADDKGVRSPQPKTAMCLVLHWSQVRRVDFENDSECGSHQV